MIASFDTEWSTEARFTFERLPADVQTGLTTLLLQLVINYTGYYRELANQQKAVNTTPHIHVPDWNIWLRLKTQYQEDEAGAILFIYELDELSGHEFDRSLSEIKQLPERMNAPMGNFS